MALGHARLQCFGVALYLGVQAGLLERHRQLIGHLPGDADLLVGKRPRRAAKADRADQLTPRDHGHHHVHMHPQGEQGLHLGPRRQRVSVDHLRLSPAQGVHIAHQLHRIAHARPEMDAAVACRGEPLHRVGRQVEYVHDDVRDAKQLPQCLDHRPRNRLRCFLGDQRLIDLVQEFQSVGIVLPRRLCLPALGDVTEETCKQRWPLCANTRNAELYRKFSTIGVQGDHFEPLAQDRAFAGGKIVRQTTVMALTEGRRND